jgi:hypothetical protein
MRGVAVPVASPIPRREPSDEEQIRVLSHQLQLTELEPDVAEQVAREVVGLFNVQQRAYEARRRHLTRTRIGLALTSIVYIALTSVLAVKLVGDGFLPEAVATLAAAIATVGAVYAYWVARLHSIRSRIAASEAALGELRTERGAEKLSASISLLTNRPLAHH